MEAEPELDSSYRADPTEPGGKPGALGAFWRWIRALFRRAPGARAADAWPDDGHW